MNILYVTDILPDPSAGNAGGKIFAYYIKEMRNRGHNISSISVVPNDISEKDNELASYYLSFKTVKYRSSLSKKLLRVAKSSYIPPEYVLCDDWRIMPVIRELLSNHQYDVVHVIHPWLIRVVNHVRTQLPHSRQPAIVGHVMDVVSRVLLDQAITGKGIRKAYWAFRYAQMSLCEYRDYGVADALIVHSQMDESLMQAMLTPCPPVILSPIWFDALNLDMESTPAQSADILYVGSSDDPRMHKALAWFLELVYPKVLKSLPATVIHIAGVHQKHLSLWTRPGVVTYPILSTTELLRLYSKCSALIFPLQEGRYTVHVKILNAIALRCPVVITNRANSTPFMIDSVDAIIVDDPSLYAERLINLLCNPEQGRIMANRAIKKLKALYPYPSAIVDSIASAYNLAVKQNNPSG